MAPSSSHPPRRRIESLDQESLRSRLLDAARALQPDRIIDDLEIQHLTRVITACSLILTDVYSEERLLRIMQPERGFLANLIRQLIEKQRQDEGEVLYLVRRLPDDVRLVGDKALFDVGLLGIRAVKGYDLQELGSRAYRVASEALELLAEDRRLREFFKANRLLMLPLEEEVVFLRHCADNFRIYADILKGTDDSGEGLDEVARRVPLMAAAADALEERPAGMLVHLPRGLPVSLSPPEADIGYLEAARGESGAEPGLSRDQLLSVYERILLFSAIDLERLKSALNRTVIDQSGAVETLCDEFSLFAAGTRDLRKPPAYVLVGPTGVGKNHLVESLCRTLQGIWHVEIPTLTIEGPNYTYPSDINELRGATRGFIRSDEEGLLTAFHEKSSRAPLSIVLVDEIEKAHSQLLTFFLSILDRGTTTDNRGRVLNFSNCMFFFTSNLGYSDAQQRSAPIGYMDEGARSEAVDTDIRKDLRRALKPEFVNRVKMVHFNRLTRESAERILDLELDRIARRYREMHGLTIEVDAAARRELIRRGFSPTFGARHLAATLETVCNVEIAKKISRDDRGAEGDRASLLGWLREMRDGERAANLEEVKRRVLELTRARLDYSRLRIVFGARGFEYLPDGEDEPAGRT